MILSLVSTMVDKARQVPTPSAVAWRINAATLGGPAFVVMRVDEEEARTTLAAHLIEIGKFSEATEARDAIRPLPAEWVSVIW